MTVAQSNDKIILDSDIWEDVGTVYKVKEAVYYPNSTRVDLEFTDGSKRVVSKNWIRVVNE